MLKAGKFSDKVTFILIALAFISAGIGLALYCLESGISEIDAESFHAWFQFIFGNWPEWEGIIDRKSSPFSAVMVFKLLLAIAPIYGIFATLSKLVALERSRVMRYVDLISARDALLMREIINEIDAEQDDQIFPKLLKAFEQADSKFYSEQLPSLVSPDLLDKVRQELFEDVLRHK
jgi:hypothetical protein